MASYDRSPLSDAPVSGARFMAPGQVSGDGVAVRQPAHPDGLRQPDGLHDSAARCKNKVLAALPRDSWERLQPHMRRVLLHQGDVLQESGAAVEYVYFIESGMVSLVIDGDDGARVEVGVTGREGVVGGCCVLGNHHSVHLAIVQVAGNAYRIPDDAIRAECKRGGVLQNLLHGYMHLLLAQSSQSAFCNRVHTLEERLSRWLLTVQERMPTDDLDLTPEFISHMLGVRRSGVTVALGVLQQAGLIDTARGHITIRDRDKLKTCACECYETVRARFESLDRQSKDSQSSL